MMTEHETWLALGKEDAIEPELPICDTHHHLWDMPGRRYLLDELFRDIGGGHDIVRTVFVENDSVKKKDTLQPMEPVEETKRVHEMTVQSTGKRYGKTRVAAGIVGFADLTLGAAVAPVLEAHIAASDRFRGIRQLGNWDENQDVIMSSGKPGLLLNDKFREGFAYLGNYDISFETFLFHPQLMDLVDLAKAFPDIPVILEHAGGLLRIGPYAKKHEEVIQTWKDGMAALADCPNVSVKLGGFGMPIFGFGWHEQPAPPGSTEIAEKMAPFVFWCVERFGADRCMFESNFPVDRISYSYTVMWNAFKRVTAGFSFEQRKALFFDTAARVYRLPSVDSSL